MGVQRQGTSTSCVSATANFASPYRGIGRPSSCRRGCSVPLRPMTDKPHSLVSQLRGLTRDSFIYGIGGLVSRFLAVILLPLYTSYVSPGDYGRIEILMSAMAVAVTLLRGGAN